jgi:hypothetical protein
MAMGTNGQQFTFAQLAELLQAAGFINVSGTNLTAITRG